MRSTHGREKARNLHKNLCTKVRCENEKRCKWYIVNGLQNTCVAGFAVLSEIGQRCNLAGVLNCTMQRNQYIDCNIVKGLQK